MNNIVFLFFRQMRRPLLTLLVVYSVSVLGLVLIPGIDDQGNVWHMDFFHAFYFISYMATTIGFGEIPYEFTDAQRLWVLITLYSGVISWLYAIGTILALVQDKTFQDSLSEIKLARSIRQMREPFYLVCGYGETGTALVKGLTEAGQHVVIIEIDETRSNLVKVDNLREFVPSLHGDAQKPLHLQEAGLEHPMCQAVVAVTNVNEVNLKVAITSKLLHPDIKVICRADSHDVEKNMASFGTDHIIDPYDVFANSLATAFHAPCYYLLQSWFYSSQGQHLDEPIYPPKTGHWVICGYGRFGKAIYKRLLEQGIKVTVIEMNPDLMSQFQGQYVEGRGTEADTLNKANIANASGLIAGTDNDANNLSVVVTARELNENLFTIIRQNHSDNSAIIKAVNADMVMHPSEIIADKIRVLLGLPLLNQFIDLASKEKNDWACLLASRISGIVYSHTPIVEEIVINNEQASAIAKVLKRGEKVTIKSLLRDPWKRKNNLDCIILMLKRENGANLLPEMDTELKLDDKILICSARNSVSRFYWILQHDNILSYVMTGKAIKQGWLWKKLKG